MFHSSSARRLAALRFCATAATAALATFTGVVAVAQSSPSGSSEATTSAPPGSSYKSALEGYQPFADDKPFPWKEANETVFRRGGWQADAKEASGSGPAAASASPPGHSMAMHGMSGMSGMSGEPAKKDKP